MTHTRNIGKSWEPITGPISPGGIKGESHRLLRQVNLGKGICEALSTDLETKEM